MHDLLNRLYRTKMLLSCVLLMTSGTVLIILGRQLDRSSGWSWLALLPWGEIGGILIGAGLLSIWLDHFFQREQQAIDDDRLRTMLHDQAPTMRDAVLEAFAANLDDLKRVATPETLDRIITNSLALRLQDPQFAAEIYADIRDQAIGAAERWHDAELSIDLSPWTPSAPPATQRRLEAAGPFFAVTVRWEYTVVPRHSQRRFVCLSDRQEYAELVNERNSTSAWYLKPGSGLDGTSPDAFELLRFSVNGEARPIRRAIRKTSQTYTVSIGSEVTEAGEPVTIAYTYRTVTRQAGHVLFFDIEQPTRGLRVSLDYAGCEIATVSALDLIPSVRPTRIERTQGPPPPETVRVDIDGWVFPRSGIAFVWTLESEGKGRIQPSQRHAS